MPKTNIGKWSVGLIIAMFILLFIGSSLTNSLYESVSAGSTIVEDIISFLNNNKTEFAAKGYDVDRFFK